MTSPASIVDDVRAGTTLRARLRRAVETRTRSDMGRPLNARSVNDRAYVRNRVKMLTRQIETAKRMAGTKRDASAGGGIADVWRGAEFLRSLRARWLALLHEWQPEVAAGMAALIDAGDVEGLLSRDWSCSDRLVTEDADDA